MLVACLLHSRAPLAPQTTHKKALKKRLFSHQQGGKPLAKARACAIFRADSLARRHRAHCHNFRGV